MNDDGSVLGEAMQLVLQDNLPFITIVVGYNESIVEVSNVLIDTGSASSIFATDIVDALQIVPLPQDTLHGKTGTSMILCFTSEKVCDNWRSCQEKRE